MAAPATSHQWVRSVLLVVSTLAVVGVLFAFYIGYAQAPEGGATESAAIQDPTPLNRPPSATQPASVSGPKIGGIPLSEGGKIKLNLYPREGTEARLELAVDSFRATGRTENEMELDRPVIRFRTPSGQLVKVESDKGVVELTRQRGESYDLARGKLSGQVKVVMDRLTREERGKLPPEQQDQLTEERVIRAEMDDLTFDLEYARVESGGRVFASLAEAEFEGRGLLLRYDEAGSRIEHLKINQGDHITLRRLGGTMAIGLPSATAMPGAPALAAADISAAATQPAVAEAPKRPLLDEDGVPYFMPDAPGRDPRPRPREAATYHASFDGDVIVDQFQAKTQVGLLTSDHLAFLFDFGQRQREQARLTPTSRPDAPSEAAEAGVRQKEDETVVLRWKGPLVVDLVRDDPGRPPEGADPRVQITASGEEVYVADRRGNARCRKLVHHQETQRVWLEGVPEAPLVLDLGESGQLSGREVFWDGMANTVNVTGPGRLIEARSASAVRRTDWVGGGGSGDTSITFGEEMKLCVGVRSEERIDPVTGDIAREERQVLQTAVLVGGVVMRQGGNSVGGDRVEVGFGPPLKAGSFADNLQSLKIEGRVVMVQGEERITCDTMDVALAPDPSGRTAPLRAVAVGNVSAVQGARAIAARDRMIVELQSMRVEKPPFDPVQAKVIALQRGLKVEDIDWARRREEYEREDRFEPGLRRLEAYGEVKVEDPSQNLSIDAGTLDCGFKDGRQIERGRVMGTGGEPASIAFGDFGIVGQKVDFDATMQWAEVPGPGRITFLSRKDLDGRVVDTPIPTAITWARRMNFRGRENQAVFAGAVHAVSETSTIDCGEMILDFVEDQSPTTSAAPSVSPRDWWVLRPWTVRGRASDRAQLTAPPIRKQLAYLTAREDVVALTAAYDPRSGDLKSRARVAGPRLAVDLRNQTQTLTIDDAGTLLIEDYELKAPDAAAVTKTSPFGLEGQNLPSQTFISWQGSMSYYAVNRLAVFDRDVDMAHRSGSMLVLAQGVLSDAALAQLKESGKGRDARLNCRQLNVQFRAKGEAEGPRASKGLGGMSGNEVAGFAANGDVYFEDSGVSVTSRTVTFDRERNVLQILGTDQTHAELIDVRAGRYRSIKGPEIFWDRGSDRIEAPRATIRSR